MEEAGWLENQGRITVQIQSQSAGRISSRSEEVSLCSIKAFEWLNKVQSHYVWRVICFTSNVPISILISFTNIFTETSRMFDYISGYHGPANLMHKKQSQKPNRLIIEKRNFPGMLCARNLAAVTALWSNHIGHVFSDDNRYFSFLSIMVGSFLKVI